jgi:DMSO reductase anchor subunit
MDIQWPLVVFTLFTGTAGWAMFFTGLNEFTHKSDRSGFVPGIVSIALLAAGAIASTLHLSHPDRIMGALAHPTSGIFTEFVLVMLLGISILVYLVCLKRGAQRVVKVFAVSGMVFGVLISFMAGDSYIMASRAAWDTVLLPVAYLGTAIPAGAALYWALACRTEDSIKMAAFASAIGGGVALVTVLVYTTATGVITSTGAVYTPIVLCCSGLIPFVCGLIARKRPHPALMWTTLVFSLAGGFLFRIMMWVVGVAFYNFFG